VPQTYGKTTGFTEFHASVILNKDGQFHANISQLWNCECTN